MLIVMKQTATADEMDAVCERIASMGFEPHPMPGATRTAIGVTGNQGPVGAHLLKEMCGVLEVIRVSKPFKLVSRETRDRTIVEVGGKVQIGKELAVIAGPCSIESYEQASTVAHAVKAAGANIFRGGAFKPRSSPYSFQGLGKEGLEILATIREETGMPVCTEALDEENLELVAEYADIVQVGTRNMQNFSLLRKIGQLRKPVLLKRGMAATLEEFLMSAEYILSGGNYDVILCERGIRAFSTHSRNTLDLSIIPAVQTNSHLPIIADPSHGVGIREAVEPMALASVAAGADGLMIEVHHDPDAALSDGAQSLLPEQFQQLMDRVAKVEAAVERPQ